MLSLTKDPRIKEALTLWRAVAPDLGLDPAEYRHKLLWQKSDPGRSHIVLRLAGPRALILKSVFAAPKDAALPETVAAQRDACARLSDQPEAHAPDILFASPDGRTVLMTEAAGKTLNDHLSGGRAAKPLLRRTGAWLDAFHRAGPQEARRYQPRYMVEHALRMGHSVDAGDMQVAMPTLFVGCCAAVADMAERFEGQPTVSTVKHGDFNLRNIILGPDGATGLDFKPLSTAPVGFDIARILMDYAELFQDHDTVAPGHVLAPATLEAFFDGYRLVRRDDPAVQFLPFVQMLNDWRLIPPDPARRSWRQAARMATIETLARRAFSLP